jgi:delta8-fatty-acid desaturase
MCREATAVSPQKGSDVERILREGAGGKSVEAQLVYLPKQLGDSVKYYTRDEVATLASKPNSIWIIVHDAVYDLTSYATQHPGGQLVLQHFNGRDATDVVENYHRAHVFQHILPRFYRGQLKDPSASVPPHVEALRQVRQDLLAKNQFIVPRSYYVKLHAWLATLFLAALYYTVIRTDSLAWQMTGAVLLGLFWQQYAGLGHDIGHTAVTKNWTDDHWAGSSWGAAFTGLSTAWWKHNHNTHHVVPNAVEDDPNIQHLPLLAVSEQVIEAPYKSTYHNMRPYWLSWAGAFVVSYQHYSKSRLCNTAPLIDLVLLCFHESHF